MNARRSVIDWFVYCKFSFYHNSRVCTKREWSPHITCHNTGYWGRRLYDGVQEDAPLEPPLPLLVGAVLSGGAALGVALAHVAALQHEVVTVAEAVGVQPCNQ